MLANTEIIEQVFKNLQQYDTVVIPSGIWYTEGGIRIKDMMDITIDLQGTLTFNNNRSTWPVGKEMQVEEALSIVKSTNVTLTSSTGTGIIDGQGESWWGVENFVTYGNNRPKILFTEETINTTIEKITIKNAPYRAIEFQDGHFMEVRNVKIDNRGDASSENHDDSSNQRIAYNTDGIVFSGSNVYIHDVEIDTHGDAISVKGLGDDDRMDDMDEEGDKKRKMNYENSMCTENIMVERITATGSNGFTIGAVHGAGASEEDGRNDNKDNDNADKNGGDNKNEEEIPTCIRNITFRDSILPDTFSGLSIKAGKFLTGESANVSDVLFEDITISNAQSWALWIGPTQAVNSSCSMLWPHEHDAECTMTPSLNVSQVMFKDITVVGGAISPGVMIGNESNPMTDIVFDNVLAHNAARWPWGSSFYACYGMNGTTTGNTYPQPQCFNSGAQCKSATRHVIVRNDEEETEPTEAPMCTDDNETVKTYTGGLMQTCLEVVSMIGEDICNDENNEYYELMTQYCKATCGLCARRARRSSDEAGEVLSKECKTTLSYTCGYDDTCYEQFFPAPAKLSVGGLFVMMLIILGVAALFMLAVRAVGDQRSPYSAVAQRGADERDSLLAANNA